MLVAWSVTTQADPHSHGCRSVPAMQLSTARIRPSPSFFSHEFLCNEPKSGSVAASGSVPLRASRSARAGAAVRLANGASAEAVGATGGSGWGALLAGADLVGSLVRDRQSGSGAGSTALVHAAVAISVGTGADRVPRRPRECRVALSGGRAWPRWPAWLVALCLQRSRQRRSGLRLFSSALKRQLSTARCEAVAPATQGGRCRSARFVPKFVGFYEPVCSGSPVMAPARSRAGRRALTARWA
jgi:hypothetical protein